MKKRLFVLSLTPMLLASCVGHGVAGTYSFQLGKEEGSHMAAFLRLSNEDFVYKDEQTQEETIKGKKYELELSMDFGVEDLFGPTTELEGIPQEDEGTPSEGEETPSEGGETPSEDEDTPEEESFKLNGYYNLGESFRDGSTELKLGITLTGELELLTIEDEIVESIVYSTINGDSVSIAIPVSVVDLALQLYWYGYDFDFETFEFVDAPKHQKGTHPTVDEIKAINDAGFGKHHKVPFVDTPLTFRDYNTVHIGLTKE